MNIFEEIKRELHEMKTNPEVLEALDTEMEKILKEIIKIERRFLYGLDSSSTQARRTAIFNLIAETLKNKGS